MKLPNKRFEDYSSNSNILNSAAYRIIIGGLQKCGVL